MAKGRISSETLFNFTDTLNHLINNLQNGIYCHFTYEKLPYKENGYYIHMACFCDIPLSMTDDHFEWYGRYGIGIKRAYARTLDVKPVWYIHSDSNIARRVVNDIKKNNIDRDLIPFMKSYMGDQEKNVRIKNLTTGELEEKKILKRKRFYDEREWRYVPKDSHLKFALGVKKPILFGMYIDQECMRMKLDLDSIEYIIVSHEKDVAELLQALTEISRKNNYSYEKLVSKIMTARQIQRDF